MNLPFTPAYFKDDYGTTVRDGNGDIKGKTRQYGDRYEAYVEEGGHAHKYIGTFKTDDEAVLMILRQYAI